MGLTRDIRRLERYANGRRGLSKRARWVRFWLMVACFYVIIGFVVAVLFYSLTTYAPAPAGPWISPSLVGPS